MLPDKIDYQTALNHTQILLQAAIALSAVSITLNPVVIFMTYSGYWNGNVNYPHSRGGVTSIKPIYEPKKAYYYQRIFQADS